MAWEKRREHGARDRDYDRKYNRDPPRGWEHNWDRGGHLDANRPMALPCHRDSAPNLQHRAKKRGSMCPPRGTGVSEERR